MDEVLLVRVLTRLVQVRLELGNECYRDAAHRALVAIGTSVMRAAEREADLATLHADNVVSFPSFSSRDRPADNGS